MERLPNLLRLELMRRREELYHSLDIAYALFKLHRGERLVQRIFDQVEVRWGPGSPRGMEQGPALWQPCDLRFEKFRVVSGQSFLVMPDGMDA